MDYRIEKREAFQMIAKRASYEGGGEIASKNTITHGKRV